MPRTIAASEAIYKLSAGGQAGRPVAALIITQSGKVAERPLAVVVSDDRPVLMAALVIN